MDPLTKMYMFYQWIEDINEQVELFKNHGYLIGSFTNPEAVQKILGGNTLSSSEEEFEQTSQIVAETIRKQREEQALTTNKRRRRRKTSI